MISSLARRQAPSALLAIMITSFAADGVCAAIGGDAGAAASSATPTREVGGSSRPRASTQAYLRALSEGRRETTAQHYAQAVAAFTRALAVVPNDARALTERGYAQVLADRPEKAIADLDAALAGLDPADKRLGAQIEFNLGLAYEQLRYLGRAFVHFRRSNELSPTSAARAKESIVCPVTVDVPTASVFPSLQDALDDDHDTDGPTSEIVAGEDTSGTLIDERRRDRTHIFLPLAGGRIARFTVGETHRERCGLGGEIHAERVGAAWKVVYQEHRTGFSTIISTCDCDGGESCYRESRFPSGDRDAPACTCPEPQCQVGCTGGDDLVGQHVEAYFDARTGVGLGEFDLDHDYLDLVTLHADVSKRIFRATGAGCP